MRHKEARDEYELRPGRARTEMVSDGGGGGSRCHSRDGRHPRRVPADARFRRPAAGFGRRFAVGHDIQHTWVDVHTVAADPDTNAEAVPYDPAHRGAKAVRLPAVVAVQLAERRGCLAVGIP
ncbi:hypothetical protein GCM10027569_77520 [Flindersiella endophytica]